MLSYLYMCYSRKCRQIDVIVSLGVLLPSSFLARIALGLRLRRCWASGVALVVLFMLPTVVSVPS